MKYEEFITALEKTPRDWFVQGECIRRRGDDGKELQCPISSLCNLWSLDHETAMDQLGLSFGLGITIILAADHAELSDTRKDLLRACGLMAKEAA